MLFHEIIGQKQVKKQITGMIGQQRLSHALLFLGPEGNGGLSLARATAQYMVCEKIRGLIAPSSAPAPSLFGEPEPQQPAEPAVFPHDACGQCPSCNRAAKMIHPDIHYAFPVIPTKTGEKPVSAEFMSAWREFLDQNPYGNLYDWLQHIKAENSQGNITARECAEIIQKMSLKSFESGYKILILWMPEMLGQEGNKLLKLIEEPPKNTLFLLVAENESQILPTILSRTQLVKIPRLTQLDVEAALELREGLSVHKARQVAALAEGNYLEALRQIRHADDDWNRLLRDWLNAIIRNGPAAQLKWIEEVAKLGREKQKQLLAYSLHVLELAERYRLIPVPEDQADRDDILVALKLAQKLSTEQLQAAGDEMNRAIYHIERNAHAKILFHSLTIRLCHIINNNSVILVS